MRDWDCIGCPPGQRIGPSTEAMSQMIPGELDAGKPPVQFDEGRGRATGTDNYGRLKPIRSALPTLLKRPHKRHQVRFFLLRQPGLEDQIEELDCILER